MNKEYRLADGTFARLRPQKNTLWLDDMFMGIPAVAYMGRLTGEAKYYDEAVKQVRQFAERMWVPEKKLFRHGWVEEMVPHTAFHWGRANGWAILTLCEVLDVLPENHPDRQQIMELLRAHAEGLAALQHHDGFWHQLLDRNDTYLETSATAIYAYCMAHAVNRGWLNAKALHLWRTDATTDMDTSIDVGAESGTQVYAPVTGTVVLVGTYKLYETIEDYEIHIQPEGRPDLDVVEIHIKDVQVKAGDKVIGGETPLAKVRDLASEDITDIQLAFYSKEGHGNHTHVQVNNANADKYREMRLKDAIEVK